MLFTYLQGLKELLDLEESEALTRMLKDVIETEPPDFPKLPTEDEAVETTRSSRKMTLYAKDETVSVTNHLFLFSQ